VTDSTARRQLVAATPHLPPASSLTAKMACGRHGRCQRRSRAPGVRGSTTPDPSASVRDKPIPSIFWFRTSRWCWSIPAAIGCTAPGGGGHVPPAAGTGLAAVPDKQPQPLERLKLLQDGSLAWAVSSVGLIYPPDGRRRRAGTCAPAPDATRPATSHQEFAPGYLTDIPSRVRLNDVSANKSGAVPVRTGLTTSSGTARA
jgi:hypothetical protein